jgi:hypothetical protein
VTQKTVGAGPELTEADEIANPASWTGGVDVDVDGDTGTITITGTGGFVGAGCGGPPCADYGLLDIWLDDLEWVGEVGEVAGVSTLSDNLMDPTRSFPFTLTTSHTADSVHLAWVVDTPPDDVFFVVTGATAVFEIQTTHIPEPTTALLIACGLVGLGVRGRLH